MNRISASQPKPVRDTEVEAFSVPLIRVSPPEEVAFYSHSPNGILLDRSRNAHRRRFWQVLACTLLILGALHAFPYEHKHPTHPIGTAVGLDQCSDHALWERVPNVPHTSSYRVHLRTSLTLPMSADMLSIVTRGSRTRGSLEVSQIADAGSDAVVDVDVFYRNREDFDEATTCRLHPSNTNNWGLGIFTRSWKFPPHGDKFHQLLFNVHLRLPATPSLRVPQLKTDLRDFSQHIRELADSVHFDKLTTKSTNGHIEAESVAGDKLELHTTNATIQGHFKTTSNLSLKTTRRHIMANVSLLPWVPDSKYTIWTRTANAPIALTFIDAPADHQYHKLRTAAHTSNDRVEVTMHDTFEGAFDVHTTNAAASVAHIRERVHDPAGLGRIRGHAMQSLNRNVVRGSVWWDEANKERGRVSLRTSNAVATLTL